MYRTTARALVVVNSCKSCAFIDKVHSWQAICLASIYTYSVRILNPLELIYIGIHFSLTLIQQTDPNPAPGMREHCL